MRWLSDGTLYLRPRINVFELGILLVSLVDIGADFSGLALAYPTLQRLRVVRSFRVLRLAWLSNAWMKVLKRIGLAVPPALSAMALLMVFMVTFATLGMGLYGGDYDAAVLAGRLDEVPRLNFDSFIWALLTIFDVADNENWNDVLYGHISAFGNSSALFFLAVIFVGNYFFLNMCVGGGVCGAQECGKV